MNYHLKTIWSVWPWISKYIYSWLLIFLHLYRMCITSEEMVFLLLTLVQYYSRWEETWIIDVWFEDTGISRSIRLIYRNTSCPPYHQKYFLTQKPACIRFTSSSGWNAAQLANSAQGAAIMDCRVVYVIILCCLNCCWGTSLLFAVWVCGWYGHAI